MDEGSATWAGGLVDRKELKHDRIMKPRSFQSVRWGWGALTAVYLGIFLTILVLAYTGNLPPYLQQNDKLGHLVLYGLATYLGHRILKYRRVRLFHLPLPLFPLLFSLFTVIEEGAQSLSPNRTLDAIDLLASFAGIGLGYWLAEREKGTKKATK